ncbi:unnamed protein product [Notodromas monacha]|uniref:LDLR chaperone boca n=1 Tax=Notodromas monacha TaxID=399045 RepID=A0A7R9BQ77_9CRUS|nr:unnamed protein product [Notodromas monacha]CAG0919429.1 unnamed protein product [Notodromas monacha]
MRVLLLLYIASWSLCCVYCKKREGEDKPTWAKKDVRDYTDADLERLFDQWEEDEEPLEPDELPEHLRPRPNIDMSQLDFSDPEKIMQMTKKGQTVMAFVRVSGNPTAEETKEVTSIWQQALWNNHIQAEQYPVDDNRVIFLFKDGSQAWKAKDFLLTQEKCADVTIEGKTYPSPNEKKLNDEL